MVVGSAKKAKSTKPKQRRSNLFKLPVIIYCSSSFFLSFSQCFAVRESFLYSIVVPCFKYKSITGKHNKQDANSNNYILIFFSFEIGSFYL